MSTTAFRRLGIAWNAGLLAVLFATGRLTFALGFVVILGFVSLLWQRKGTDDCLDDGGDPPPTATRRRG